MRKTRKAAEKRRTLIATIATESGRTFLAVVLQETDARVYCSTSGTGYGRFYINKRTRRNDARGFTLVQIETVDARGRAA